MKKTTKKMLVLILCLCTTICMIAGCGNNSSSSASSDTTQTDSSDTTQTDSSDTTQTDSSDTTQTDSSDTTQTYSSEKVDSTLAVSANVQSFVDNVDTDYGYNLAHELAYNEDYWDNELGWRSAGSDAEHRCADYLEEEMKKIGLTDVQKVAVDCDKFQFNGSSLKITGTDIELEPASYQCNGTEGDLTAEIVDCGTGFEADYDGKDVKGKIVLVGVDQKNESWIDNYIEQAYAEGAAALVTYTLDGYGRSSDDTINVQDICCGDKIPTTAISYNEAQDVLAAIEAGNNEATLNVDAEMVVNGGTTYNVMGIIKGKSSDNRIIISGHYDKYWYGFQDDCCAIGLVYTVAKAMIDSGYTPENDIVFIAHGGEEWGKSDSCFDWTAGAWGMIEKNVSWQNTTLAMLNCELPAYKVKNNTLSIGCVPEFRTIAEKLINETGLVVTSGDVKLATEVIDSTTMEDGVAYRWHGVPYFINSFEDEEWIYDNYHTISDNEDTYDEDTFRTNINWYGALAMYIDSEPALELDLTQTADDLEASLDEDIDGEAGIDIEAYKEEIVNLKSAAESNNTEIARINSDYEEAAANKDEDAMKKLRNEAKDLNAKNLNAFGDIQEAFCKVDDFAAYYGHPNMTYNVQYLDGVIQGLKNGVLWGDDEDGALDYAWQLNSAHDYNYILFSKDVADAGLTMYDPDEMEKYKTQWGYERTIDTIYVGEATYELNQLEDLDGVDTDKYIKLYQQGRETALKYIKAYGTQEIESLQKITNEIQ